MEKNPHFAGFWIRLVAHVIDSIVLHIGTVFLDFIFLGGVFWFQILVNHRESSSLSFFDLFDPLALQVLSVGVRSILGILYFTYLTWRFGTTAGKRLFGISVVSAKDLSAVSFKQALFRSLGYFISAIPLGLGYIMAGFDSKK